jgi:pimeloyl-ACP methyl ester carboxylesterase
MPYALRTRFKKEIVAEFLPAIVKRRRGKKVSAKNRVVIILDGMPTIPSKRNLIDFFSRKGYWVFHPRYRGSWESDGKFLEKSPEQDVLDVIDGLSKGFQSLDYDDHKKYRVMPDEIIVIASSFGGPAGILASRDPRVKKVICVSPVVDWQAPSKSEPLPWFKKFVHDAFGNGYRFGSNANEERTWKKLARGKFYNPVRHVAEIDGSKLLIFHARDDESVRAREVIEFTNATGAILKLLKKGGHLSSSRIIPKYWPQIAKFFRTS